MCRHQHRDQHEHHEACTWHCPVRQCVSGCMNECVFVASQMGPLERRVVLYVLVGVVVLVVLIPSPHQGSLISPYHVISASHSLILATALFQAPISALQRDLDLYCQSTNNVGGYVVARYSPRMCMLLLIG